MELTEFAARLEEATNAHDVDAIAACFSEDYENATPCHPARGFVGVEQVRRNWSAILGAVPDLVAEVRGRATSGAEQWLEWEMRGVRRDGHAHLMRGVTVFTVVGDQATSARFFLEPVDQEDADADTAVRQVLGSPR